MPTYHGLIQATCLDCGKVTKDTSTLEMLNDLDPRCLECQSHLVAWFNEDGMIAITGELEDEEEIRVVVREGKETNE